MMNRAALWLLVLPLTLAGCGGAGDATLPAEAAAPAATPASGESADELARAVRGATARYHSTEQAVKDGYAPSDFCVPGMGFHWVNEGLVDPVYDPLEPEVMLYAEGPNGQLRLVAVEYIVIDAGQPRPAFGERPFDVGGTPVPVAHWSQHVWLYEENPAGMLEAFNPGIGCS